MVGTMTNPVFWLNSMLKEFKPGDRVPMENESRGEFLDVYDFIHAADGDYIDGRLLRTWEDISGANGEGLEGWVLYEDLQYLLLRFAECASDMLNGVFRMLENQRQQQSRYDQLHRELTSAAT